MYYVTESSKCWNTNTIIISVKESQTPKTKFLVSKFAASLQITPNKRVVNKVVTKIILFFTLCAFFARIPFRYYILPVRGMCCRIWLVPNKTNSIVHSSTIQWPLIASSSYSPNYTRISRCLLCWHSQEFSSVDVNSDQ